MQNMVTKTFLKQNLYVRGIPKNIIKDEELKKFFEQFGKVKNAKVYVQETGEKDPIGNPIFEGKQFGFVCFETQKDALKVSLLPPQQLIFNDYPLEVFFYEPKAHRAEKMKQLKAKQDKIFETNPFMKLLPNIRFQMGNSNKFPINPKQYFPKPQAP